MRKFSVIVATDREGGIGVDNRLPWRLPRDMAYFKHITIGQTEHKQNAVIMGRKTWESLPSHFKPLPQRLNVVLSRSHSQHLLPEGVLAASSLEDALSQLDEGAYREDIERVFVIGGGQIYREGLTHKKCENIYLTKVFSTFECDTYFPEIPDSFKPTYMSNIYLADAGAYAFYHYKRL